MRSVVVLLVIALAAREAFAGPSCRAGQLPTTIGVCCWPGQSTVGGACVGAPQCPTGMLAAGDQCVVTPAHAAAAAAVARDAAASSAPQPALVAAVAPAPGPEEAERMQRARFSGKRFLAESGVGVAVGLLTSLLLCNESACPGHGFTAFFVDLAATPIAVWGIGGAMGGKGSLLDAYVGASAAVAPLGIEGPRDETPAETISRIELEVEVSAVALPFCAAIVYEFSSHFASKRWFDEHAPRLTVRPLVHHDGMAGGIGALSLRF